MIRKYNLQADSQWIYVTYLHTLCRICRKTGGIDEYIQNSWQPCRDYSTVMTIYDLLCYHKGEELPLPAGQWCTVGAFVVTGVTNTQTFTGKYARYFDERFTQLKAACQKIGGILQQPMAGADLTCRFQVTPFFEVLLQFWTGDEEFQPRLLLLWDRHTDQLMHFETTFYLQGDLLARLKNDIEEEQ